MSYWTPEHIVMWAEQRRVFYARRKAARRNKRIFGALASFYLLLIAGNALILHSSSQWWTVPFNTAMFVFFGIQCLHWWRMDRLWSEIIVYADKLQGTSMAQLQWSLGCISGLLLRVERHQYDLHWSSPNGIKARIRSYYWWCAWKAVKSVRIFIGRLLGKSP